MNLPNAKVALFDIAVSDIFENDPEGIPKSILGVHKGYPVLFDIFQILLIIPFKIRLVHIIICNTIDSFCQFFSEKRFANI